MPSAKGGAVGWGLQGRAPGGTSLQNTAISSEQALLSLGRRRTSRAWMMLSLSSSLRQASVSLEKLSRRHWCTRPSPARAMRTPYARAPAFSSSICQV